MSVVGKTDALVGAQIIVTPIQMPDATAAIDQALEVIRRYPLTVETNAMATLVRGELSVLLRMTEELYLTMNHLGWFTLDIRLSNTCGL